MVHKTAACQNTLVTISPEVIIGIDPSSTRTSTSGSVDIPAIRTVQGQRSFGYTCSKDFNSLPLNLKSIKEYKYFKRETKERFSNLLCSEC